MQEKTLMGPAVLLTGSVKQNSPFVGSEGVQDSQERLLDYLCAIEMWLSLPEISVVVYCDASGYRLPESLFENAKLETLAIDLNESCRLRGKGFAETYSIQHAIRHSRLLPRDFFKCTGRLFVMNFTEIWNAIHPVEPYFYLDVNSDYRWTDTKFFWFNRDEFESKLFPHVDDMNDDKYQCVEYVYYQRVQEYRRIPKTFFIGRSANDGRFFEKDYSEEIKKISRYRRSLIDENTLPR